MKNMMIALCMFTISYAANAQEDPAFRFGIKAGANLSNINGSNDLSLSPGGNAFDFKDNDNRSLGFAGGFSSVLVKRSMFSQRFCCLKREASSIYMKTVC